MEHIDGFSIYRDGDEMTVEFSGVGDENYAYTMPHEDVFMFVMCIRDCFPEVFDFIGVVE